jgi:hypothetical protein
MSTLDQQLMDVRDRMAELDENSPTFDQEFNKCIAWTEVLIKGKELRDGVNYSSMMQIFPHMKILNFKNS